MKNINKFLTAILLTCMVLISGGLLYASIYASGSPVAQPNSSTLSFGGDSHGIVYNTARQEFEIYTSAGVSWLASNYWVRADGEVHIGDGSGNIPTDSGWDSSNSAKATGEATYRIMNDITYRRNDGVFHPNFDTNLVTLENEGILDGGGHTLKGFPFRTTGIKSTLISNDTSRGLQYPISTLFYNVKGTIRYLNVEAPNFNLDSSTISASSRFSVGIISAFMQKGTGEEATIINCEVTGYIDATGITTSSYTYLGGVVGWADGGTFSDISLSVVLRGRALGGLVGEGNGVTAKLIVVQSGSVLSGVHVGGIVGTSNMSSVISSSKNFGSLWVSDWGGGITSDLNNSTIEDCKNYGDVIGVDLVADSHTPGIGGISGLGQYEGGILGCTNYGNIILGFVIGGILGYYMAWEGDFSLSNNINYGNVLGDEASVGILYGAGGLVGATWDSYEGSCFFCVTGFTNFGYVWSPGYFGFVGGNMVSAESNHGFEFNNVESFAGLFFDLQDEKAYGYVHF